MLTFELYDVKRLSFLSKMGLFEGHEKELKVGLFEGHKKGLPKGPV